MFTKLTHRVAWIANRIEVRKYFRKHYVDRVTEIQNIYCQEKMGPSLAEYFAKQIDTRTFRYPYFDVVSAYANHKDLSIRTALHVGCFGCQDSMFLADSGYSGRIVAADFDSERLAFLRHFFAKTKKYSAIEFRKIDLERPSLDEIGDCDLIFCLAVLSNIQPEGLLNFFSLLRRSKVRLCIFGDIYSKQSLLTSASDSIPCKDERNWMHPYLSIGKRYGFDAGFLPNFYDNAQRGIFILSRGIDVDIHMSAIGKGYADYFARQPDIFRVLDLASR